MKLRAGAVKALIPAVVLLLSLAVGVSQVANAAALERPDPAVPQGENLQVPLGWQVRPDRPQPDLVVGAQEGGPGIYFVNMTPGWHLTTGPAAIFYHPASTASGEFTARAVLHLFDPGERQREAFGMFLGGSALDGDDQAYVYFLIRNTGEFLIKRRSGAETHTVNEWTASPAILRFTDETETSAANELAISVMADTLSFVINGTEVAKLPQPGLETGGIVGLRVNHGVNLHISDLSVKPSSE